MTCDLQAATRRTLDVQMRGKRERVDKTVAHVASAIAQVRELTATLKAVSASVRAPQAQIFYMQSAALHRGEGEGEDRP